VDGIKHLAKVRVAGSNPVFRSQSRGQRHQVAWPVRQNSTCPLCPALIHAAASRSPLDLSGLLVQPHLGDELDLCYVSEVQSTASFCAPRLLWLGKGISVEGSSRAGMSTASARTT
jgi:hypothetical protein